MLTKRTPKASPVALRVLTNSELKCFRRCAYEHHLAYGLGYRSVRQADALRFGTLIHSALDAWWSEPARTLRLQAAIDRLVSAAECDPFEFARAAQMLTGYDLRWRDEPLEAVAVEPQFRAPLVNPKTGKPSRSFELGGKCDKIARHTESGRLYLVEHKTSGDDISPGSAYWQVLQLDTQVAQYYEGARALGHDVAGVIYDVLWKPRIKPLVATPQAERKYTREGRLYAAHREYDETPGEYEARVNESIAANPDRYFARGIVVRFEDEEREAAWDRWVLAQAIREGELAERFPRNPDACRRFGRLCSYFGHCTRTEALDDATKFRIAADVHEELMLTDGGNP